MNLSALASYTLSTLVDPLYLCLRLLPGALFLPHFLILMLYLLYQRWIEGVRKPRILDIWDILSCLPFGKSCFGFVLSVVSPYTGSIGAEVEELSLGHSVVYLNETRLMQNPFNSVHACALMNLGECAAGLAVFTELEAEDMPCRARGIVKSVKIDYIRKSKGRLRCSCDSNIPRTIGKYEPKVEAHIYDESGEETCRIEVTWYVDITPRKHVRIVEPKVKDMHSPAKVFKDS